MGGELRPAPAGASGPTFVAWAMHDPKSVPLERLQIVKGWLEEGELREQVLDVAGAAAGPDAVDLNTCQPEVGTGADSLCARWRDPDFDPGQPAFYYLRVLETPTCRWSQRQCLAAGIDCASVDEQDPLAACCDGSLPATLRERAWTSPIWHLPE